MCQLIYVHSNYLYSLHIFNIVYVNKIHFLYSVLPRMSWYYQRAFDYGITHRERSDSQVTSFSMVLPTTKFIISNTF